MHGSSTRGSDAQLKLGTLGSAAQLNLGTLGSAAQLNLARDWRWIGICSMSVWLGTVQSCSG